MKRTLEPELMDDAANAEAYAAADFAEVNARFVDRFCEQTPSLTRGAVVDLGCGPGDVAMRLVQRQPRLQVVGVDGAEAMLQLARTASSQLSAELRDRLTWICARLPTNASDVLATLRSAKTSDGARPAFDAVISNSLLHHLPDPQVLWRELVALGAPGSDVLVVDLMRPDTTDDAKRIVQEHSADDPEILRTDFYNSLLAAFTPDEVEEQLDEAGLALRLRVETISDRHIAISGRL